MEWRSDSISLGPLLEDVRHVHRDEPNGFGGHQPLPEELNMQLLPRLTHRPVVECDGDCGVPLGVAAMALVQRRGNSQARLDPRHRVRSHATAAHFLQPCGRPQHDVQLPGSRLHPEGSKCKGEFGCWSSICVGHDLKRKEKSLSRG